VHNIMQSSGSSPFFKPEEAYATAAEGFFELMKSFGMSAGQATDWTSLAAPLASQFERWLQMSQAAAPWFSAARGAPPFVFGAAGPAGFGALPMGPAAVQGGQVPRSFELLGRLAQLQGELTRHWSEIATTAAQRFIARLGKMPTAPATPQEALKLYELWVNCAEEAYGATVHKEEFGRLQAELTNTFTGLLAEQRQQAETLVRGFGLPTRNEVDALYTQLKELREQVTQLSRAPRGSPADDTLSQPAAPERAAKPAAGGEPPGARARPRKRRPQTAARKKGPRRPRR
jgi:hypothetical protein